MVGTPSPSKSWCRMYWHFVKAFFFSVPAERMAACYDERNDSGCPLFPRAPQPGRRLYPLGRSVCPSPAPTTGAPAALAAWHASRVAGVGTCLRP